MLLSKEVVEGSKVASNLPSSVIVACLFRVVTKAWPLGEVGDDVEGLDSVRGNKRLWGASMRLMEGKCAPPCHETMQRKSYLGLITYKERCMREKCVLGTQQSTRVRENENKHDNQTRKRRCYAIFE